MNESDLDRTSWEKGFNIMKFGYFYASSPEIEYPEVLSLPPLPGIVCIEVDEFPKLVNVALNTSIIGTPLLSSYTLHVDIFYDGIKIPLPDNVYAPFRERIYFSKEGEVASRYSFIEIFNAEKPGVYTFRIRLYDGSLDATPVDSDDFIHQLEASIILSKDLR